MTVPDRKNMTGAWLLRPIRAPDANRSVQENVLTSSAVSKTAGITVENETEERMKYSSPVKFSPPRYFQFCVRSLMISNSHHAGADRTNSKMKSRRDRASNDVPLRARTSASVVRMYPTQSGKKRYAVGNPGRNQFKGQN